MAKPKTGSVPNKALYSRVSYLYQAAAYMATQQHHAPSRSIPAKRKTDENCENIVGTTPEKISDHRIPISQPASRRMVSELRAVSHKVLMRMSPTMKHSLCKNCDTMLIDGATCTSTIENRSKGGNKPWADILVRRCTTCGIAKRFPLNSERQKRRPQREVPTKVDDMPS